MPRHGFRDEIMVVIALSGFFSWIYLSSVYLFLCCSSFEISVQIQVYMIWFRKHLPWKEPVCFTWIMGSDVSNTNRLVLVYNMYLFRGNRCKFICCIYLKLTLLDVINNQYVYYMHAGQLIFQNVLIGT